MLNIRGTLYELSTPKIMGILNLTPDSFSDGGKFSIGQNALRHAEKMIAEGAHIIDIGAQSTRPNSEIIPAKTERERLGTVISELKREFPETLLSLDTFYGEVVKFGFQEGIDIINDISGGDYDDTLLAVTAQTELPYILMHSSAHYSNMHKPSAEADVIVDINKYFSEKVALLEEMGIKDIILDPGFGFGKTIAQQYQMADELEHLGFRDYPLLVGISRKSFIYKSVGKSPLEIDEETQKLHLKLLQNGAKILRVHEVKQAKEIIAQFKNKDSV